MPISVLSAFLLYCAINAFTPGPGNLLALNTVTAYGWRNGRPLFFGIFAGYYVVQLLCALFVYGVSSFLPDYLAFMKYAGAAYILWLAWRIAVSVPDGNGGTEKASFLQGFLLQFVNVKIYLFGITALTCYVTDYYAQLPVLLLAELFVATLGTAATSVWIGLGVLIRSCYQKHFRLINAVLALTLLECVWSMFR